VLGHSEETRQKVLALLSSNRSRKEIETRTGVTFKTIQLWEEEWRNQGLLPQCKRKGMNFVNAARIASNGYYACIRKRYNGMQWTDKLNKREFGFVSQVEAIPYFLDRSGTPRSCTYCGAIPPAGKVWGLDRLNSDLGHAPGNVVPCCGTNETGNQMSCQASKSRYPLREWMAMSMARTFGRPATEQEVNDRLAKVSAVEAQLAAV